MIRYALYAFIFVTIIACKNNMEEPASLNSMDVVRIHEPSIINLENHVLYRCDTAEEVKLLLGKSVSLNVDFNKNGIILLKDIATHGVDKIDANIEYSNEGYSIDVKVTLNYTLPLETWCIGIVVPKIDSKIANLSIEYFRW